MKNQLLQGDSLKLLPKLTAASFDAVITDPPYASGARIPGPDKGRHPRNTSTADYTKTFWAMSGTSGPIFDGR